MLVQLLSKPFEPYALLAKYPTHGDNGATSICIGNMRVDADKQAVSKLFIEHYPAMTLAALQKLTIETINNYHLNDALVVHRIGDVYPHESIVVIACWSTHRAAAINASKHILETLKSSIPLWKKEFVDDRAQWVRSNTSAYYE